MENVIVTIDGTKSSKWGIVTNIEMGLPKVVEKTYTVPGRNGVIDASEALTGYPVYGTREIAFEIAFIKNSYAEYQKYYDEINQLACGKRCKLIFSYDSGYYYDARLEVEETQERLAYGSVKIKGTAEPYALAVNETKVSYTASSSGAAVTLPNGAMPAEITLAAGAEVSVTRSSGTKTTYSKGTHRILYPLLAPGGETVTVTGSGTGSFAYRKGKL